jgi:hypothetical protein
MSRGWRRIYLFLSFLVSVADFWNFRADIGAVAVMWRRSAFGVGVLQIHALVHWLVGFIHRKKCKPVESDANCVEDICISLTILQT